MRFLGILGIFFLSISALAQSFLPNTDDIPQMPGLTQIEEVAAFDHPNERMVIIAAYTTQSPKIVLDFYRKSLMNLGWQEKSVGHYTRQHDTFNIEITPDHMGNRVQFLLNQSNE